MTGFSSALRISRSAGHLHNILRQKFDESVVTSIKESFNCFIDTRALSLYAIP